VRSCSSWRSFRCRVRALLWPSPRGYGDQTVQSGQKIGLISSAIAKPSLPGSAYWFALHVKVTVASGRALTFKEPNSSFSSSTKASRSFFRPHVRRWLQGRRHRDALLGGEIQNLLT